MRKMGLRNITKKHALAKESGTETTKKERRQEGDCKQQEVPGWGGTEWRTGQTNTEKDCREC